MGMFDSFVNEKENLEVQLKVGVCNLEVYKIGDYVEFDDGIYFDHASGGYVVIENGKVLEITYNNICEQYNLSVYNKYGEKIKKVESAGQL